MAQIAFESYPTLLFSLEATTFIRRYVFERDESFSVVVFTGANGSVLLQHFFERHPGDSLTPVSRLTCGGLAGITSVTFTYPLDIVRTRLSIQSASFAELGEKPKKLPGMWQTMTVMYKTEGGFTALYRGIVPTVTGVAPYVCVPVDRSSSKGGAR